MASKIDSTARAQQIKILTFIFLIQFNAFFCKTIIFMSFDGPEKIGYFIFKKGGLWYLTPLSTIFQ
jgi:hypothetical protein